MCKCRKLRIHYRKHDTISQIRDLMCVEILKIINTGFLNPSKDKIKNKFSDSLSSLTRRTLSLHYSSCRSSSVRRPPRLTKGARGSSARGPPSLAQKSAQNDAKQLVYVATGRKRSPRTWGFRPPRHSTVLSPTPPHLATALAASIRACRRTNRTSWARDPLGHVRLRGPPLSHDQAVVHLCCPSWAHFELNSTQKRAWILSTSRIV